MNGNSFFSSQPEGYSQLIKRSVRLYRAGLKQAVIFSFILSLVLFSPRLISFVIGQDIFLDTTLFNPNRLWLVLADLASLVLFIAIFWHYFCVARGQHEPLAEDFSKGLKKVVRVFIAGIVQSVVVMSVMVLVFGLQYLLFNYNFLFAGGLFGWIFTVLFLAATSFLTFYVSALFIFQVPLIVIENRTVFVALERSVLLVWNHWLRTVCVQVTPWLLYLACLLVVGNIFDIKFHFYFVRQETVSIVSTILQMLFFTLLLPWVATLLLIQMKDLEIRNHIKQ